MRSFTAKKVLVSGLTANVKVIAEGNEVVINMSGGHIDQLAMNQTGDAVSIGKSSGSSPTTIQHGDGKYTMNITGSTVGAMAFGSGAKAVGSLVIGGNMSTSMGDIEIRVPKGTELTFQDISGKVEIGDTEGPVIGTFSDDNHTIGHVHDVDLTVKDGYITVHRIDGKATLKAEDTATIDVMAAELSELKATSTGHATVRVNGKADHATFTQSGKAKIVVSQVVQRPVVNAEKPDRIRTNWQ